MQVPGLTRLWFMRHGEVEDPFVGRFVGCGTDIGLSEVGRHQSAAIASFLEDADVDAVLTSPMKRSRTTAVPFTQASGLKPEVREGLREMDFGEWEGQKWEEIEAGDMEFAKKWQGDPGDIPCPGGETANIFSGRVVDELREVLEEFEGRSVAIFAHAGTNRAILTHFTGRPYMESFVFSQDYGCVNAAGWDPGSGSGQIALVNLVPGPRSEMHGDGGRKVA